MSKTLGPDDNSRAIAVGNYFIHEIAAGLDVRLGESGVVEIREAYPYMAVYVVRGANYEQNAKFCLNVVDDVIEIPWVILSHDRLNSIDKVFSCIISDPSAIEKTVTAVVEQLKKAGIDVPDTKNVCGDGHGRAS